jgi:hypothetical protein
LRKRRSLSPRETDNLFQDIVSNLADEYGYVRPVPSVPPADKVSAEFERKWRRTGGRVGAAFRIWWSFEDPVFFSRYYLRLIPAQHQIQWIQNFGHDRVLQLAPRKHGKSTIYSYLRPVYRLCCHDGFRILLVALNQTMADKFFYAVKTEFEENERIIADFGDLRRGITDEGLLLEKKSGGRWTSNLFYLRRHGEATLKDPSMESAGMRSGVTGSEFDEILIEDPQDEDTVRSARRRQQDKEKLDNLIENLLAVDGRACVCMTRKHAQDYASYLEGNPRWVVSEQKGIIRYPKKWHANYEVIDGKKVATSITIEGKDRGEVLWDDPENPNSWPIEKLLLKEAGMLPHIFKREIQNEIKKAAAIDLFPLVVIQRNYDEAQGLGAQTLPYNGTRDVFRWIVVGADFGGVFDEVGAREAAETGDTNYNFYVAVGMREHGGMFLRQILDYHHSRGIGPDQQLAELEAICNLWRAYMAVVEANLHQRIYALALKRKAKIRVMPHVTGKEKWDLDEGVPGMALDFKNGLWVLPRGDPETRRRMDVVEGELMDWGTGGHDDCVMGLWMASMGCEWIEKRWRAKRKEEGERKQRKAVTILG